MTTGFALIRTEIERQGSTRSIFSACQGQASCSKFRGPITSSLDYMIHTHSNLLIDRLNLLFCKHYSDKFCRLNSILINLILCVI